MAVGLLDSYRQADLERSRKVNSFSQPILMRGTGFLISPDGVVVTAFHVIDGAESITVTMHNGKLFNAELISFSKANDL